MTLKNLYSIESPPVTHTNLVTPVMSLVSDDNLMMKNLSRLINILPKNHLKPKSVTANDQQQNMYVMCSRDFNNLKYLYFYFDVYLLYALSHVVTSSVLGEKMPKFL